MKEFNDYCFKRIKETNQYDKLFSYSCQIEPDSLYMGACYDAASFIIPKDKIIVDLGCYMSAQAFLFENHKAYIGLDLYPERFITANSIAITGNLEKKDWLDVLDTIPGFSRKDCYVIMNAVPISDDVKKEIFNTFSNIIIAYPGQETIAKGMFAEQMVQFTDMIRHSETPYTQFYLNEHPDVKAKYDALYTKCIDRIKDYLFSQDKPNEILDDLTEEKEL